MPEISRFFGIIITMYYNDHAPPHFHAKYAEYKAKISVETGELLEGRLPRRVVAVVEEWRRLHVEELGAAFDTTLRRELPNRIPPLE